MTVRRVLLVLILSLVAFGSAAASAQESELTRWEQVGDRFTGQAASTFGFSVALSADGGTLAVGAQSHRVPDVGTTGQVTVYRQAGGTWAPLGQPILGTRSAETVGTSVALSADGNTVAYGANSNTERIGEVQIATLVDGGWIDDGTVFGDEVGDRFGEAVALSADATTLVVGALDGVNDEGYARAFERAGDGWVPVGDRIDGERPGDAFGLTVDVSADGDLLAVGAPAHDSDAFSGDDEGFNVGQIKTYRRSGDAWVQLGAEIEGDGSRDSVGGHLSLAGNGRSLAIGLPRGNGFSELPGAVRVLDLVGDEWVQRVPDLMGEQLFGAFGASVALSDAGTTLVVGATDNGNNTEQFGSLRVYQRLGDQWRQVGQKIDGVISHGSLGYSSAISADGQTVTGGAPELFGTLLGDGLGSVRVFELDGVTCGGFAATIVGSPGDDVLIGTSGPDVIAGLQGNDAIRGFGGDDVLCGGAGSDVLAGGQGFDVMYGAQGNDTIYFADGQRIDERSDDAGGRAFGGAGNDDIYGSTRWDRMQGGAGKDRLFGFEGRDWLRGGFGADVVSGGPNIDDVNGGPNNDRIFVVGADRLRGGLGVDSCLFLSGTVPPPLASSACENVTSN